MTNLKQILVLSSFALFSAAAPNAHAMLPVCQSASSDSDGDGYGWENNDSCIVNGAITPPSNSGSGSNSGSNSGSGLRWPACVSAASDPDGDGFGWENNDTCQVTSNSSAGTGSSAGSGSSAVTPSSSSGGRPSCVSASSDPDGDGYGWENNDTCLVTSSTGTGLIGDDDGNNNVPADNAGTDNGNTGGNSNSGSGGTVNRTTSLTNVATKAVTTDANGGDRFATERVGDFLLMQNAWRASRAAPGYVWSQTIQTNTNGAPVGWIYDWGPGVPGGSGRASDDFYVRSYPELIFGIKDEFRTSAPKAQIGFPVRVDQMPNIQIDYSYNAPEFGAQRTVNASVTNRFPNGSIINGERNVAAESFLYAPTNGVCDDNLAVTRSNGSNHLYEVMVWLDSGAERLPAASRDFVTDITIRGADYKVYTKSDDDRYIAFVAQNPQNTGTIYWNDYLNWARQNAHRVGALFGANADSVQIQDSWCVANIIVGTEIFWGAGQFELFEWTITQSQ